MDFTAFLFILSGYLLWIFGIPLPILIVSLKHIAPFPILSTLPRIHPPCSLLHFHSVHDRAGQFSAPLELLYQFTGL